jgi:PAS domain S-box-containing protein
VKKQVVLKRDGSKSERDVWLEKLQFLGDAMESTSQPFCAYSPECSTKLFNEAFCRLTGYSREELYNITWATDLTTPDSRMNELNALKTLNSTHETQRYEKDYRRKDGSVIHVELLSHVALDSQGNILFYYSFITDISERKKREDALRRSRDELETCVEARTAELAEANDNLQIKQEELEAQAEELEVQMEELRVNNEELEKQVRERLLAEGALQDAKAQAELYVDLMGHDINNMNQSAMGYLELALDKLELDKKLGLDDKVLIETPLKSLYNTTVLIDNVRKLQWLMREGVRVRPIIISELIKEVDIQSFHNTGRDITISIPSIPPYQIEATELLRDVFINLISNSIKHSDEDKPLTVNVNVEPISENCRSYYRLTVEDNGPGIPDELKKKLFHRFQRGSTKALGRGLGLYLVRTIVEGFNGKVWVEDRVQGDYTQGSRFVIMLPAYQR